YYPFGLQHKGYNNVVNGQENNYQTYNGVEWNESLGLNLYEMDMRQFDPAIARWTSIDPVTHWSMSTYTAFDNNPVYFADPSGANSTAEWMEANGITQDDLITIYQAEDSSSNDSSSDCPPGDPNCSKKGDGTIQNQFEMSVDEDGEGMAQASAMLLAISTVDGPLPFADGAAATIGLNILVAYAIAHGTVGMINSMNESVLAAADANWVYAKQEKEIERIMTKEGGPPGMVYMLTVNKSGNYIDVRGNSQYLNAGEVWRYGETTKGYGRYTQSKLDNMVSGGVTMKTIFFGNTVQIKVQEKIMIYGHFLATGSLPPGNKIFR
ncbi:MAG: RHS repeat-associated core domain-containing protein, partial [Gelidibacter sp.]